MTRAQEETAGPRHPFIFGGNGGDPNLPGRDHDRAWHFLLGFLLLGKLHGHGDGGFSDLVPAREVEKRLTAKKILTETQVKIVEEETGTQVKIIEEATKKGWGGSRPDT